MPLASYTQPRSVMVGGYRLNILIERVATMVKFPRAASPRGSLPTQFGVFLQRAEMGNRRPLCRDRRRH